MLPQMATQEGDACHIQEVGIEMFRVQEQLARLQNRLEDCHKTKSQAEAKHWLAQDQLKATKTQYSSITSQDMGAKANGEPDLSLGHPVLLSRKLFY